MVYLCWFFIQCTLLPILTCVETIIAVLVLTLLTVVVLTFFSLHYSKSTRLYHIVEPPWLPPRLRVRSRGRWFLFATFLLASSTACVTSTSVVTKASCPNRLPDVEFYRTTWDFGQEPSTQSRLLGTTQYGSSWHSTIEQWQPLEQFRALRTLSSPAVLRSHRFANVNA